MKTAKELLREIDKIPDIYLLACCTDEKAYDKMVELIDESLREAYSEGKEQGHLEAGYDNAMSYLSENE